MWNTVFKASIAVGAALVIVAIGYGYRKPLLERHTLLTRKAELEQDVKQQQAKLDDLKIREDRLQTDPRFVEKIAREDFGYAKPGETIFKFEGDASAASRVR